MMSVTVCVLVVESYVWFFFFKQKTAYEMRISDWISDVCSSDLVMDELAEIFADLGFSVATGPEIEDDWHNFTALNMAETHPARAMHDTFYFPDRDEAGRQMLLRTHTRPVQIRAMVEQGAPLRIIAPGRVYRSGSDETPTPMFPPITRHVIDSGNTPRH